MNIKVVVQIIVIGLIFCIQTLNAQIPQEELDAAIWIIRQYGSNIVQDIPSICASAAFKCENGHLTRVSLVQSTNTFLGTGLIPDPSLTALSLPECVQFDIHPIGPYRGDPNQSILTKLTIVSKVITMTLYDDVISNIPIGFLNPFIGLSSMILSFGNITVLQEGSFEVTSASITNVDFEFTALKSYPSFSNSSSSLLWRSLTQLSMNINSSAADSPISLTFSPTIFPNLVLLQLFNLDVATITISISCINIYLLGQATNGFALTVPNPSKVVNLRIDGQTTVSPPLEQFVNLITLTTGFSNSDVYPFSKFPPKLEKFSTVSSAMTTFPTSPTPPVSFKGWSYTSIIGFVVIPWALLTPDNTSRLLDISNNPILTGSVPDSFCINKLIITDTNILTIPYCYWCYYNDPSVIQTSLAYPTPFTCQPSIDNSTIFTKGFRGLLFGSYLGWGNTALHATQGYYTLTPIVPHKILELYYRTIGSQQSVSIKLNEKESYIVDLDLLEVGIILTSVNVTQIPTDKLLFTWMFLFYNDHLQHEFQLLPLQLGRECQRTTTNYNSTSGSSMVICELDNSQLNMPSYTFRVSNPFNQETFTVPFKYYPRLVSGQVDSTNQRLIYLFGDFGQNHSLAIITINHKIACSIVSSAADAINCTLSGSASYGPANVSIVVDGKPFEANDFLFFKNNNNGSTTTTTGSTTTTGGGTTPQTQCQESTSNCFGHGSCDVNGRCQCDSGYNPIDNCLTKFTNSTPITNTTAPTSSFEVDGTRFDFELVAIQELDNEGIVVGELLTNSWNATINNDTTTTLVTYQLVNISNALYIDTIVQAMISFSTQPRDIQFGDQLLHINPNSIKLALNITNWQYNNLISTLRVVFRTDVNMNQTIEYDCKQQSISTFSYDQLSSTIQYLRVIKDNVQYNGRFIDYVLSDGRPTFSKTTLINQTTSQSSSTPTTIMSTLIGVSLPQCQSCLLDPDFTPLLIDYSQSDCDSTNSKTWKIIVGVVVGGFAAIAIAAGTVIYMKKKKTMNRHNKSMQNKLKNMSKLLSPATSPFIINTGLVPDPSLTALSLPECAQLDIHPIGNFRGDPNQSILTKLTIVSKVKSLSMYEDVISNIPIGFLKPFTSLISLTLDLGNITVLQEGSFEVTSATTIIAGFEFIALKSYPSFSNRSSSLLWRSLTQLSMNINSSASDSPISLTFSPTVFPNLVYLQLSNLDMATITVSISCINIYLLGQATNGFALTVPNPSKVVNLRIDGQTTVSPPLEQFLNLKTLTTGFSNSDVYPFSKFPPKLEKFLTVYSAMTTFPTSPTPPVSFKEWKYSSIIGFVVIPWALLTPDNTSRLLDISNNTTLDGLVSDSFCIT
ncbi:hypothetical protein DFA_00697 [Cavenderia fasciculata]|uniref:EGF-like domain-containing protein n=1 Tax=Cavenderia fasciculata TaxID=261658 RepID=F4PT96_CACFS|nr:uncharacterized protein DFA_00697 [Cavenderia fasciculata]EGG20832.1 hypothetical protein DFA_00697 [Cavenderia fasciculata]|eukprot:XP_004358682.1 hypothetical protein DFA_00697 [Cavenderia fasciculata]